MKARDKDRAEGEQAKSGENHDHRLVAEPRRPKLGHEYAVMAAQGGKYKRRTSQTISSPSDRKKRRIALIGAAKRCSCSRSRRCCFFRFLIDILSTNERNGAETCSRRAPAWNGGLEKRKCSHGGVWECPRERFCASLWHERLTSDITYLLYDPLLRPGLSTLNSLGFPF